MPSTEALQTFAWGKGRAAPLYRGHEGTEVMGSAHGHMAPTHGARNGFLDSTAQLLDTGPCSQQDSRPSHGAYVTKSSHHEKGYGAVWEICTGKCSPHTAQWRRQVLGQHRAPAQEECPESSRGLATKMQNDNPSCFRYPGFSVTSPPSRCSALFGLSKGCVYIFHKMQSFFKKQQQHCRYAVRLNCESGWLH